MNPYTDWEFKAPTGEVVAFSVHPESYVEVTPELILDYWEKFALAPEGHYFLRVPASNWFDFIESLGWRAVK